METEALKRNVEGKTHRKKEVEDYAKQIASSFEEEEKSTSKTGFLSLSRVLVCLVGLATIFVFVIKKSANTAKDIQDYELIEGEVVKDRWNNKYSVLAKYPRLSFHKTRGLAIFGENLVESVGGYGESSLNLMRLDLVTNVYEVGRPILLEAVQSGAGVAVVQPNSQKKNSKDDQKVSQSQPELLQLTWKNNVAHTYSLESDDRFPNPIPSKKSSSPLPKELGISVGITSIAVGSSNKIIVSSGQNSDLKEIALIKGKWTVVNSITVKDKNGNPSQEALGVLSFAESYILAGVVNTTEVLMIDPRTFTIHHTIDFSELKAKSNTEKMNRGYPPMRDDHCLFGIAYDQGRREFYITGSEWYFIYRIKLPDSIYTRYSKI